MNNEIDLQQLAIERGDSPEFTLRARRHTLTRYVIPAVLLLGFLALLIWASWNILFPPRPVTTMQVLATQTTAHQAGAPLFKAAGWVEPRPTPVHVAALAPGVVRQLLVVEDQLLKAGEPVAELIQEDAKLALDRALADLSLRQATLEEAEALSEAATSRFEQPVHLQAPLQEAEGALAKLDTELASLPFEIRQAEAELTFAKKSYEAKRSVEGAIAGRVVDEAKSRMDSAEARLAGLKARTDSLAKERTALEGRRDALKTQLELMADETKGKREAAAKIKAATALVQQATLAVDEAKLRLQRMTVRSPIDGRVLRLIVHPGARVGSGMGRSERHDSSTIVTMYQPDMLQVRVDVRFEDLPKLSLGQPAEINNPALESPLLGKVLFIGSEADIQKNTLQAKVAIESPASVLKPEMLMDVTFLAPKKTAETTEPTEQIRIYLPQQLIQQDDSGMYVWLADRTEKVARRRRVETGGTIAGGLIEVTRGLTPTSRIITSDHDQLRDGTRIRISGEEPDLSFPGTRENS